MDVKVEEMSVVKVEENAFMDIKEEAVPVVKLEELTAINIKEEIPWDVTSPTVKPEEDQDHDPRVQTTDYHIIDNIHTSNRRRRETSEFQGIAKFILSSHKRSSTI
jgi:hypothetical protein